MSSPLSSKSNCVSLQATAQLLILNARITPYEVPSKEFCLSCFPSAAGETDIVEECGLNLGQLCVLGFYCNDWLFIMHGVYNKH